MTAVPAPARDLPRILLSILFLSILLVASLWILRPFLAPIVWATLIVVATWPLLGRAHRLCRGRRWLAVTAMVTMLLLVFLLPLAVAALLLVDKSGAIVEFVRTLPQTSLPAPPAWLTDLPGVGPHLASTWRELTSDGPEGLAARLAPHTQEIVTWLAAQVGTMGVWLFQVFATLVLAGVLYARGEAVGEGVRDFFRRLAGERGDSAVILAAKATRAVAFGVLVTALVQAMVGGLGLLVAGVPAWKILTAAMFLLSIAQLGAAPVLGAAALWVFSQGNTGWGIGLGVWALVVGSLDNVIRPILIGREAHIPVLMVFAGVIGGLLAFGPVGLFAGPVVLAVTDRLLRAWVKGSKVATD